jgi:5'-deoxynucleotidase YfbR-like HD superfamily hydrolase
MLRSFAEKKGTENVETKRPTLTMARRQRGKGRVSDAECSPLEKTRMIEACHAKPCPLYAVFRTLHRLKQLPRQGFVHFGFKRDETDSIAAHSFMVTWISYLVCRARKLSDAETARATLIALVHDWGECVCGDLSYRAKSPAFRKTERAGFNTLVNDLRRSQFLRDLWAEYEDFKEKRTNPGAVVKFADGLDAWLQGIATKSTWWPAWQDYNQSVFATLSESHADLAAMFRRTCDMARDPNVQVWLPNAMDNDFQLWSIVRFLRTIYSLKELPRHGFAMFGMKRSETDSFAGHGFSTASLALLIATEILNQGEEDLFRTAMVALCHDLPVALTGDAAYDLQLHASQAWQEMTMSALDSLLTEAPSREEVRGFHDSWLRSTEEHALIVKAAAAVDAWEVGVTTPTAWIEAWIDYSDRTLALLRGEHSSVAPRLASFVAEAREALGAFTECTLPSGLRVGREPEIKPIRLGRDRGRTTQSS